VFMSKREDRLQNPTRKVTTGEEVVAYANRGRFARGSGEYFERVRGRGVKKKVKDEREINNTREVNGRVVQRMVGGKGRLHDWTGGIAQSRVLHGERLTRSQILAGLCGWDDPYLWPRPELLAVRDWEESSI